MASVSVLSGKVRVIKKFACEPPGKVELEDYPIGSWRRAIGFFLDVIWSQDPEKAHCALAFEKAMLVLKDDHFTLQTFSSIPSIPRPNFNRDQIHAATRRSEDVQLGLARFLRNNHTRMLVIEFADVRLMLWKGQKRSELYMTVTDRTF